MKPGDKYYALMNDDIVVNFMIVVYGQENTVKLGKKQLPFKLKLSKETIETYRKRGMTSEEIAKRLGVSKSKYFKICHALGIKMMKTRPTTML